MIRPGFFRFPVQYSAKTDIGKKRKFNQDEIITCPEYGFFAVSDGMGGLSGGGETSALLAKTLPLFISQAFEKLAKDKRPEKAARLLKNLVGQLSDNVYEQMNRDGGFSYGATLCGVWLVGGYGIFVNLGDSRGYALKRYKKRIRQVTVDHNLGAQLIASGELVSELGTDIGNSSSGLGSAFSALTRFVGMASPALPETFIEKLEPGDRLLLCSDGLYGMVPDRRLPLLARSSKNPTKVVEALIAEANDSGGRDNIAACYVKAL
jgi:serine/threonine protein phosphatase PrpC